MVADAGQQRLELLINLVTVRQYLKEQSIKVANEDVEKEITRLRLNPPASGGCPCCSYASLDAFLTANFMTRNDLRQCIYNEIGMNARWLSGMPISHLGKSATPSRQRSVRA
jgi:hypothetical protein